MRIEGRLIVLVDAPLPEPDPEFRPTPPLQPKQHSRFLRRLPVMLYRLGLGPVLGAMPLLILSTRGRNGHTRYTPLEYRRHGRRVYVLASGGGARWLKRVYQDEVVTVRIGTQSFPASATVVTDEAEAARVRFLFRLNAPPPLRWIYWSGRNQHEIWPPALRDGSRSYTVVRFELLPGRAMAVPPVRADRVWMVAVLFALLTLFALAIRKGRG
jgi:deazaflavin-dependent oxidoreductase (nitroreductase family)